MKEIMDNGPVQGMDFSSWCVCVCVCVCVFAQYCEPEDKNSKKHMPNVSSQQRLVVGCR